MNKTTKFAANSNVFNVEIIGKKERQERIKNIQLTREALLLHYLSGSNLYFGMQEVTFYFEMMEAT